eukprot:scaffold17375_cov22-Prasinocladus_malaysianus.AAC.2
MSRDLRCLSLLSDTCKASCFICFTDGSSEVKQSQQSQTIEFRLELSTVTLLNPEVGKEL